MFLNLFLPKSAMLDRSPNVSKIEVFGGQNFRRWQECVYDILDMSEVAFALTEPKLRPPIGIDSLRNGLLQTRYVATPLLLLVLMSCLTCIAPTMKQRPFRVQ